MNMFYSKYIFISLLMITFINRGLFVSAVWMDSPVRTTSRAEVNSLLELIFSLVGDKDNKIDEDGNSQENYAYLTVFQPMIHRAASNLESPIGACSSVEKFTFPVKESMPLRPVYGTIDQPPEA